MKDSPIGQAFAEAEGNPELFLDLCQVVLNHFKDLANPPSTTTSSRVAP